MNVGCLVLEYINQSYLVLGCYYNQVQALRINH